MELKVSATPDVKVTRLQLLLFQKRTKYELQCQTQRSVTCNTNRAGAILNAFTEL